MGDGIAYNLNKRSLDRIEDPSIEPYIASRAFEGHLLGQRPRRISCHAFERRKEVRRRD